MLKTAFDIHQLNHHHANGVVLIKCMLLTEGRRTNESIDLAMFFVVAKVLGKQLPQIFSYHNCRGSCCIK